MTILVAVFGAVIVGMGIVGFVRPSAIVGFVQFFMKSRSGLYWAMGSRIVLGLLLLAVASESRFPRTLQVPGVISLVAAAISPIVGLERLQRLVQWWSERPPVLVRVWSLIALVLGAFLIHAVW
jgi:hypothetical protein